MSFFNNMINWLNRNKIDSDRIIDYHCPCCGKSFSLTNKQFRDLRDNVNHFIHVVCECDKKHGLNVVIGIRKFKNISIFPNYHNYRTNPPEYTWGIYRKLYIDSYDEVIDKIVV